MTETTPPSHLPPKLPAADELTTELRATYRLLARHPGLTPRQLAEASGLSRQVLEEQLHELESRDLVAHHDEAWRALPPQDDMERLLAAQERSLGELRQRHRSLRLLQDVYSSASRGGAYDGIELVTSREELLSKLDDFQARATDSVRAFDRAPHYTVDDATEVRAQLDRQDDKISRGVLYRVIYEPSMWDDPVRATSTLNSMSVGEEARLFHRLPMKLYLFDNDRAVLPLDPRRHADGSTLIVHPSGLLQALAEIFEIIWGLSAPISGPSHATTQDDLDGRERSVLALLASGASDVRIMHRLDVSRSTVTRTVSELCAKAHVETRFQLAAEAVRRGWL